VNGSICLIDDDELFRRNLAAQLRALGLDVHEAGNGAAGETLLASRDYRATILDMLMPDIDGIEMIGRIRSRWPKMRIIAISGGGRIRSEFYLQLAKEVGADAYLGKPLHGRDLMPLIAPDDRGTEIQA
jgi:DNA-binding response OmpR family regulator